MISAENFKAYRLHHAKTMPKMSGNGTRTTPEKRGEAERSDQQPILKRRASEMDSKFSEINQERRVSKKNEKLNQQPQGKPWAQQRPMTTTRTSV